MYEEWVSLRLLDDRDLLRVVAPLESVPKAPNLPSGAVLGLPIPELLLPLSPLRLPLTSIPGGITSVSSRADAALLISKRMASFLASESADRSTRLRWELNKLRLLKQAMRVDITGLSVRSCCLRRETST